MRCEQCGGWGRHKAYCKRGPGRVTDPAEVARCKSATSPTVADYQSRAPLNYALKDGHVVPYSAAQIHAEFAAKMLPRDPYPAKDIDPQRIAEVWRECTESDPPTDVFTASADWMIRVVTVNGTATPIAKVTLAPGDRMSVTLDEKGKPSIAVNPAERMTVTATTAAQWREEMGIDPPTPTEAERLLLWLLKGCEVGGEGVDMHSVTIAARVYLTARGLLS